MDRVGSRRRSSEVRTTMGFNCAKIIQLVQDIWDDCCSEWDWRVFDMRCHQEQWQINQERWFWDDAATVGMQKTNQIQETRRKQTNRSTKMAFSINSQQGSVVKEQSWKSTEVRVVFFWSNEWGNSTGNTKGKAKQNHENFKRPKTWIPSKISSNSFVDSSPGQTPWTLGERNISSQVHSSVHSVFVLQAKISYLIQQLRSYGGGKEGWEERRERSWKGEYGVRVVPGASPTRRNQSETSTLLNLQHHEDQREHNTKSQGSPVKQNTRLANKINDYQCVRERKAYGMKQSVSSRKRMN